MWSFILERYHEWCVPSKYACSHVLTIVLCAQSCSLINFNRNKISGWKFTPHLAHSYCDFDWTTKWGPCRIQFLNPSVTEFLCLPIHRHPNCQTASWASWKRAAAASFWETFRRSCSISAFCCRISSGSVTGVGSQFKHQCFRTGRQNHWNRFESSWACRLTSADCSMPSDFNRSTSSLHFWSSWTTKSSEAHLFQI